MVGDALPETTTLYYDPVVDVHHRLPAAAALTTAYYAAPQEPDDARRLFEAACASVGYDRNLDLPLRPSRGAGSSLVLAREWEMTELSERLVAGIEASYEPTWDTERGEFTWGMGLDEPHPRGQLNAFLAAAEAAGPGRWAGLSEAPVPAGPRVVGVDFPTVALRTAEWTDGSLRLDLAPLRDDLSATTRFRVVDLPAGRWELRDAGGPVGRVDPTTDGSTDLDVTLPMVAGEVVLRRAAGP